MFITLREITPLTFHTREKITKISTKEKNQSLTVKIDIDWWCAIKWNGKISHIFVRKEKEFNVVNEQREEKRSISVKFVEDVCFIEIACVCYRTTAVFSTHFIVVRFTLNLIVSLFVFAFVFYACSVGRNRWFSW